MAVAGEVEEEDAEEADEEVSYKLNAGGRGGSVSVVAPSDRIQPAVVMTEQTAKGGFEKVDITIKRVASINMHELLLYASGKSRETENVMHATGALSVALRHVPSMLYTPVGGEFYSPISRTPITGGLEVWRGYHQSVRAMMAGHLGINVDIASTIFRKGGISLIEYILEVTGGRDVNDIARMNKNELSKIIKGVNVVTTHRGDQKQRFRIARVADESSDSCKFDKDGAQMTVTNYFRTEYKVTLRHPKLLLVSKANGKTKFPMECLMIVPAQRVKSRLSGQQTADVIKATVQKPHERKEQIENAIKSTLQYDSNPYVYQTYVDT